MSGPRFLTGCVALAAALITWGTLDWMRVTRGRAA